MPSRPQRHCSHCLRKLPRQPITIVCDGTANCVCAATDGTHRVCDWACAISFAVSHSTGAHSPLDHDAQAARARAALRVVKGAP